MQPFNQKNWKPGDIVCRRTKDMSPKVCWVSIHKGTHTAEDGSTVVLSYVNLLRKDYQMYDSGTLFTDPLKCDEAWLCTTDEIVEEWPAFPDEVEWFLDELRDHYQIGWDPENLKVYKAVPESTWPKVL